MTTVGIKQNYEFCVKRIRRLTAVVLTIVSNSSADVSERILRILRAVNNEVVK